MKFLGAPYPIVKHPNGFLHTQSGINQVKSDLLVLLLTEPGERVMLPGYGTPLSQFIFEPNDSIQIESVRQAIASSIDQWEPRIAVTDIDVIISNNEIEPSLNDNDLQQDIDHILLIKIRFTDFEDIQSVEELRLEVPLN